jgi:hypothetical protein
MRASPDLHHLFFPRCKPTVKDFAGTQECLRHARERAVFDCEGIGVVPKHKMP